MKFLPSISLLTATVTLCASASAFASIIDLKNNSFCQYSFGSEAVGKKVKGVLVHAGLEIKHDPQSNRHGLVEWVDVQDMRLTETENGFAAKAAFEASYYDGSLTSSVRPVFQFWIDFEDGTSLTLPVEQAETSRTFRVDYSSDKALAEAALLEWDSLSLNDVTGVSCFVTIKVE